MQRAQQVQTRMGEMQQQLAARRFEASSGAGMVQAAVSGALRVLSIEIENSLVDGGDRAMLQDLVAAAVNGRSTRHRKRYNESSLNSSSRC